jgi:hypothetical protein
MKPGRTQVYYLQNNAIHAARAQLEDGSVIAPGKSLEMARWIAGEINGGKQSISSLSLTQREALIAKLIEMGAQVRNPQIYDSDLAAERGARGTKEPRKVVVFSRVHENQFRMLDTLAAQVRWHTPNGYKWFCWKLLKSPRPRNSREVTKLRLALQSLIRQTPSPDPKTPSYPQITSGTASD